MEFSELELHGDLARGIAEAGYVTCMPVQEEVLKNAFGGQDLYVQSQTGTGKTAAFLVVIFQRLLAESALSGKKALIMAPTRELAVQIEEEARLLAKYLPFKIGSFYGGVGYGEQHRLLKENAQILVGTPGRVLDLNGSGVMNLMDIAFLILDEADRMFDMGFYPDLRKLIKVVPPADRRQTMLFSATLNAWVKNLAWEYTKNPFEIEIEPETVTVEEIEQKLYHVPSEDKFSLLLGIFTREQPESAIVFCNTKRYAEIIARRLKINGYECEFIMGDLPQSKRLKVIEDVKAGKIRYLVATDVAARGLDIESLAMVVNYDLPVEAENYVHRIGRTARAGKTGKAVTLVTDQDVYELPAIERYIGKSIPSEIAAPELYAEDKSSGMRIETEFYVDRPGRERPGRDRPGRDRPDRGRFGRDRSDRNRTGRDRPGRNRPDRDRPERDRPERDDAARGNRSPGAPGGRGEPDRTGVNRAGAGGGRAERGNGGRERPAGNGAARRGENAGRRAEGAGNRNNREKNGESAQKLSALSFRERMDYYREKYNAAETVPAPDDRAGSRGRAAPEVPAGNPGAGKAENAPPEKSGKKGFFARIFGFLGK
ncbi:MAG: DEAD/DEAH box helicase [Spirochaetaceae bacterium]|jgi:ATP-dependent RNA helicase RhlB|nr:DEAD/DEAH box helicase [Spirochaetaceae bacterium]